MKANTRCCSLPTPWTKPSTAFAPASRNTTCRPSLSCKPTDSARALRHDFSRAVAHGFLSLRGPIGRRESRLDRWSHSTRYKERHGKERAYDALIGHRYILSATVFDRERPTPHPSRGILGRMVRT